MPDKDSSLCKNHQVGKNMFAGKTGRRVERERECHGKQLEGKGGVRAPGA